jgi:diguanylate cyclase (GGDEF)-like protein/PAS domain S-box-containing protein
MPIATALRSMLSAPPVAADSMEWLRVLPAMAHSIDADGRLVEVSDLWLSTLGYRRRDVLGRRSLEFLTPGSRDYAEHVVHPEFLRTGSCRDIEYQMVRADGEAIDVLMSASLGQTNGGEASQSLAVLTDVTAQRATERRLAESEARFRLLAESSTDMIVMLDHNLVRRYVSPASLELFGEPPETLIGKSSGSAAHPEDRPRLLQSIQTLLEGEVEILAIVTRRRHRDGRWIWVESKYRALRDPDTGLVSGLIGAVRDVSARKAAEDQLVDAYSRLEVIAGQDGLTGLLNRRSFDKALADQCRRSRDACQPLSLLLVDVDRFKAYNDRYGHLGGDDCLRLVAKAIQLSLYRSGDFAARYGGEEFAIISPDTDEAGAAVIGERIRQAVRKLNVEHLDSPYQTVTVSVGAAAVRGEYRPEDLIALADRALYGAKSRGRDRMTRASENGP